MLVQIELGAPIFGAEMAQVLVVRHVQEFYLIDEEEMGAQKLNFNPNPDQLVGKLTVELEVQKPPVLELPYRILTI